MNCAEFDIRRVGGADVNVSHIKSDISASTALADTYFNVESGLVCGPIVGGWEFFMCKDGAFLVDEGALMVKNDGL